MGSEQLERVLNLIDEANARDPEMEVGTEGRQPKALLYGHHMSRWLERLSPDASEELKIAARGQHIRRWEVARETYPATREGYLQWRTFLYRFHADHVAELMRLVGYAEQSIQRVGTLIQKRGIKTDPEVQTLEDVVCLVFLENYFTEFVKVHDHDKEKLINIIRKTWSKMSGQGQQMALQLSFAPSVQTLLEVALSEN